MSWLRWSISVATQHTKDNLNTRRIITWSTSSERIRRTFEHEKLCVIKIWGVLSTIRDCPKAFPFLQCLHWGPQYGPRICCRAFTASLSTGLMSAAVHSRHPPARASCLLPCIRGNHQYGPRVCCRAFTVSLSTGLVSVAEHSQHPLVRASCLLRGIHGTPQYGPRVCCR